jgi:hypothetical protein
MTSSSANFGVLFVRALEEPLGLIPVRENFRVSSPNQFFEVSSVDTISTIIHGGWCGVVCLVLTSKADLIQVTKFLQTYQPSIKKEKIIRVVIFSSLNHSQVTTFLVKSGTTEVLEFDTPSRSIAHKLSVHLKLAEKAKHQPRSTAIEFDTVFKAKAQGPELLYTDKAPVKPETAIQPPAAEELMEEAVKSFEKKGASSTWNGIPVEMVGQPAKDQITVDVPKADWKVGETFTLDFETNNLGLKPLIQLQGKIQELFPHESGDREMIKVQLDLIGAEELEKIQEKVEALQDEILQFMKEAKG